MTILHAHRFFALVSSDARTIAGEMQDHFSLTDTRPYDLLPLARSPLIVIDDNVYCPYLRLLFDRMTSGLYHIILNANAGDSPAAKEARSQFQGHLGTVYEEYVDRLFSRAIGGKPPRGPVYIGPSELRNAIPPVKKGQEPPVCEC